MDSKSPLNEIEKDIKRFLNKDLPRIAGKMAVDEFRENFHRQGFRNNGITRWAEIKRRDPQSAWYGFQYKGERRTSLRLKKDRKTGRLVKSDKQKKLNFSNAATTRGILIGPGSNLMNSIRISEASVKRVVIGTDLPYAQVHNEGGMIKIFGKKQVKLPKRQFIGESRELMEELQKVLMDRVDQITDKVTNK